MNTNQLDRETPGIFQIWEHDLAEVRENPAAVHGVGACEPEQLAETVLASYEAVGRVIVALYDTGTYTSEDAEDEGDCASYLTFDLRGSLLPNGVTDIG